MARPHLSLNDLLATKPKFTDDGAVTLNIDTREIIEQTAATPNQHQQAATAVVILLVGLQVLRKVRDAISQQCDLDLG